MVIPKVLDPCCGPKSFYFDKDSEDVLFCDIRGNFDKKLCDGRILRVEPDMIADVTELPFDDSTFPLVVFDPPHLDVGNGWQVAKYGKLPPDWREWMTKAFSECWRVLANDGTLVFKWYEYRIGLGEVLKCAPCKPLFGNHRPRNSKTHWLVFFKNPEVEQ